MRRTFAKPEKRANGRGLAIAQPPLAKEERTGARDSRAANIELKLLAIDSAFDLYRSRAATATRNSPALLPLALKPLPRAAERRKAQPAPAPEGQQTAAEGAGREVGGDAHASANGATA